MISESVYRDLCVEYFTTSNFEENTMDPHFRMAVSLRVGGQSRECSLS